MKNPVDKYVDPLAARYRRIADEIAADVLRYATANEHVSLSIRDYISARIAAHNIPARIEKEMVQAVYGGLSAGVGGTVSVGVKRWYAENALAAGQKVFATIRNASKMPDVIDEMVRGIADARGIRTTAQAMTDGVLIKGDVAKDVRELSRLARRVAVETNSPELYTAYTRKITAVQRRINKLTDPSTSALKRAYQDIVDVSKNYSDEGMDRAVRYAIEFKARRNAERIVATETARAYGTAAYSEATYDPAIIGVRSVLSTAHRIYDICDYWAVADLYGMGGGVFPIESVPQFPHHPYCKCALEYVYKGEAKPGIFDGERATAAAQRLTLKQKKLLFGVKGAREFEETGLITKMRNWQQPGLPDNLIPEEKLYAGRN